MNDMTLGTHGFAAERIQSLTNMLDQLGCSVRQSGADSLECRPRGKREVVHIALTPHWLGFTRVAGSRPGVGNIESTLRRNATLMAGVRMVATGDLSRHQLVLEYPVEVVPWDDPADLRDLLATGLASLKARRTAKQAGDAPTMSGSANAKELLEVMFAEAGWSLDTGVPGHAHIQIDVPGHYLVADVEVDAGLVRLSLSFPMAESSATQSLCKSAVAALYWRAAAAVRLVRPILIHNVPGIEITFPYAQASPDMIIHACTALTVAAQVLIEEALLLCVDEDLARHYLNQFGFKGLPA